MILPLWQGQQLRQRVSELSDKLELLKAVAEELQVISALQSEEESVPGGCNETRNHLFEGDDDKLLIKRLLLAGNGAGNVGLEAAAELQENIQRLLFPIEGVVNGNAGWEQMSAAAVLCDKRSKIKRNRKRRKRLRSRAVIEDDSFKKANAEADEWIRKEISKDIGKRKMEEMKKLAEKRAKEEREELERELETILLVDKLKELRSLRIQKLKKQGGFFPEEDDEFMERVRAAAQDEEVEEEGIKAANNNADTAIANANSTTATTSTPPTTALATTSTTTTETPTATAISTTPNLTSSSSSPPTQMQLTDNKPSSTAASNLPYHFQNYYYGSSHNMARLIEVRRDWDAFISAGGSRIPGHWLQAFPPSSSVWASYIVNQST